VYPRTLLPPGQKINCLEEFRKVNERAHVALSGFPFDNAKGIVYYHNTKREEF